MATIGERPAPSRRSFLYGTTALVGAAGLVAAFWPFIDQMNPDARVRALGDVVDVDLADLRPAQQKTVKWHSFPIVVVRRTAGMLDALQDASLLSRMADPRSEKRQQPAYAKNWHRSIEPAYSVLVGICTYCACIARYAEDASLLEIAGGYFCPCCASRYDPAGRPYAGPAQYNLPVPPYAIVEQTRMLIGKNMSGDIFSFDSIERI